MEQRNFTAAADSPRSSRRAAARTMSMKSLFKCNARTAPAEAAPPGVRLTAHMTLRRFQRNNSQAKGGSTRNSKQWRQWSGVIIATHAVPEEPRVPVEPLDVKPEDVEPLDVVPVDEVP